MHTFRQFSMPSDTAGAPPYLTGICDCPEPRYRQHGWCGCKAYAYSKDTPQTCKHIRRLREALRIADREVMEGPPERHRPQWSQETLNTMHALDV